MNKILFIPSWYPMKEKLSGIFFRDQAEAIHLEGKEVSIFFSNLKFEFKRDSIFKKPTLTKETDTIVPTYIAEGFSLPKKTFFLLDIWAKKHFLLFDEYLKLEGKPSIIHAHSIIGGYLAMKLSLKYQIPYVITEHLHTFIEDNPNKRLTNIAKKVFLHASMVIGVSDELVKGLKKITSTKTMTIPNSVNEKIFYPKINNNSNNSNTLNLLCIARYTSNKKIEKLLNAYKILSLNENLSLHLTIAGSGTEEQIFKIHGLAKKLSIYDVIEWIPRLTRNKIGDKMRASDILILPSDYETFGVVLIESIACGTPVICTADGGPQQIVNSENGILIPGSSSQKLAFEILNMDKNIKNLNPTEISTNILKKYGSIHIAKTTIKMYNSILSDITLSSNASGQK